MGKASQTPDNFHCMPIPALTNGLLPSGVHVCTLDEIGGLFGKPSIQRATLFNDLRLYLDGLRKVKRVRALIIDGSFITDDPNPGDLDVLVVLDPEATERLQAFEYSHLSQRLVNKKYKGSVHIHLAREESSEYRQYVSFFQQVKLRPSEIKGVLRVNL